MLRVHDEFVQHLFYLSCQCGRGMTRSGDSVNEATNSCVISGACLQSNLPRILVNHDTSAASCSVGDSNDKRLTDVGTNELCLYYWRRSASHRCCLWESSFARQCCCTCTLVNLLLSASNGPTPFLYPCDHAHAPL